MLQTADTDLINPLVPKSHNSECQNLLFPLEKKASNSQFKPIGGFLFFAPSPLMG